MFAQDLHSLAAVPLVSKKLATGKLGHLAGVRPGYLKSPAGRHSNQLSPRPAASARAASGVRRS